MSETLVRNSSTTEDVVAELKRRTHFVTVSHVKPDGDTLGAALALGLALKSLGKHVWYFQEGEVPRNLKFLPETRFSHEPPPSGSARRYALRLR